MPTVCSIAGFRVVIHTNDHAPANVHVIGADCEAVFVLRCPQGPIELGENYRCSKAQLRLIRTGLADQLTTLCAAWERIHGPV
jgi:hypothetical protein